jgi:C-terminal processing protease CtpA/Prc
LSQSKAAGKTRLVVDVSANGGGFVIAGFELFSQVRLCHIDLKHAC